tara:strand:- start:7541 stop:7795 length:255 start_codon:yes stop_codon:yes gene_type:complete
MPEQTGTVRLHRVIPAPVERVYNAFIDKQALEYWLLPWLARVHGATGAPGGAGYPRLGTRMSSAPDATGLDNAMQPTTNTRATQ